MLEQVDVLTFDDINLRGVCKVLIIQILMSFQLILLVLSNLSDNLSLRLEL